MLGKAGEPRANARVSFTFHHTQVVHALHHDLQTDANGRILLGALPHVHRLQAVAIDRSDVRGDWPIASFFSTPRTLYHAAEGEALRIPYFGEAKAISTEHFALLEQRHGLYHADRTLSNLELSVEQRLLTVRGLSRYAHSQPLLLSVRFVLAFCLSAHSSLFLSPFSLLFVVALCCKAMECAQSHWL